MIHDPMCVELNAFDNQYGYTTSCKCERLRAYAAKVRMETQLECRPTQQEVYDLIASAVADAVAPSLYAEDRYQQGYAAALDAARDAVAALPHEDGCCSKGCACQTREKPEPCDLSCNCSFWWMGHALAAIDALREERR